MPGLSLAQPLSPPEFVTPGGEVAVPLPVVITHFNGSGDIFYTVDGSDPRDPFGNVSDSARGFSEMVNVLRATVIRARVLSGSRWSPLTEASYLSEEDYSPLVISEVMYHPGIAEGNFSDEQREFIEIHNKGDAPLDISGLIVNFRRSPAFEFGDNSFISPGQYLVLARGTSAFQFLYPGVPVAGVLNQDMSNSAEEISLVSASGATVFRMQYGTHAPWPITPDDHGFSPRGYSLVPAECCGHVSGREVRYWRPSTLTGGSPGELDPPSGRPQIVINEIRTWGGPGMDDAIELYNPHATNVNVQGWYLTDARTRPYMYQFPSNSIVPALGYLVVPESEFNSGTNAFAFNLQGDRAYLYSALPDGTINGYTHGHEFRMSQQGETFARYLTPEGMEYFSSSSVPTLGAANSEPKVGPVVINEILYHPFWPAPEFIEFKNLSDVPVPLFDTNEVIRSWFINGLNYTFPSDSSIPANGFFVVTTADPDDFRQTYGVPSDVPVTGITVGKLSNGGESIMLMSSVNSFYRQADLVVYDDKFPWPVSPDGSGRSLERIDPRKPGMDAGNWRAGLLGGSPGRENVVLPRPFDAWRAGFFTPQQLELSFVSGEGADPDNDGLNNLEECAFGLNPLVPDDRHPVRGSIWSGRLALDFPRSAAGTDLQYAVGVSGAPTGPWDYDPALYDWSALGIPGGDVRTNLVRAVGGVTNTAQLYMQLLIRRAR